MGQPMGQPTGQQAEQPSRQPGRQPSQRPVAPAAAPASEASSAPGNVVSGTGGPLAAAAAMKGVPSVQALRKRIKKGTLKSVRVLHRDSIVVGVELEELARQYPQAFDEERATEPLRTEPEAQPRARSQQPRAPGEQPDGLEAQRGNPAEEPESPHSASAPQSPVGPDEQPGAPRVEQPEPRRSQELQTVDVAIQGWREAREALEASRREHREEITRTIAAYEGRLQSGSREREQALEFHGTREARAVRWGRALAGTLLFTLAMGLWLTSRAGERLATERFQAIPHQREGGPRAGHRGPERRAWDGPGGPRRGRGQSVSAAHGAGGPRVGARGDPRGAGARPGGHARCTQGHGDPLSRRPRLSPSRTRALSEPGAKLKLVQGDG